MSHVSPITPIAIYVPLICYLLYLSVWTREIPAPTTLGLFVAGVLIWTLTEYLLHRFVFHYKPRTQWGSRLHFLMHGVHHDYPQDASRLVMPPGFSIPMAAILYILYSLIFGRYAPPTFAGMVFGYLCYDLLHYATHHFPMKSKGLLFLKQYHMRHHYQDDGSGFGVSSPVWDHVFGTSQRLEKQAAKIPNVRME